MSRTLLLRRINNTAQGESFSVGHVRYFEKYLLQFFKELSRMSYILNILKSTTLLFCFNTINIFICSMFIVVINVFWLVRIKIKKKKHIYICYYSAIRNISNILRQNNHPVYKVWCGQWVQWWKYPATMMITFTTMTWRQCRIIINIVLLCSSMRLSWIWYEKNRFQLPYTWL